MHSNQQQPVGKNDEKKLESETDVSVSITKTSVWRRLQISLHGSKQVKKYRSDLREIIMMDSGNIIYLFGNPNMIKIRQKEDMPMNFPTNTGSKIVDEVG